MLAWLMRPVFWLTRPISWGTGLIWRGIAGGAVLWLANWIGTAWGWHIGLNPVSALVTGTLGVPGFALLAGLRYLFGL